MDWSALRARFPAAREQVYADAAAIGAVPEEAAEAAAEAHRLLCRLGTLAIEPLLERQTRARQRAAAWLGALPEDLAFTESTRASMNWLAMMAAQEWERPGAPRRDEVVLLADEFPSSTLPWLHRGFRPIWVQPEPDNTYPPEKILDAVTPRTRAVVTSQVQYRTGARTDVAALCAPLEARGILHVINATQAAGVLAQDFRGWGCAAMTVTPLKWLCAGLGNGMLLLSPSLRAACRMPAIGWLSQADPFAMDNARLDPRPEASALELGGIELSRHWALDASLGLFQQVGRPAIEARVLRLSGLLADGLRALGAPVITPAPDAQRSGTVSACRPDAAAWHERAMAAGIVHSPRGADTLRFSLHFYNDEDDVARILEQWAAPTR